MFKKFCIKAFQAINLTVGATSLAAIAVGALAVFGSGGLLCLEKAGVKTIEERRIQQALYLGVGSTSLGFVGFVSASFAAVCAASILSDSDLDEEESLASSDTDSVVFKSSDNITQDNTEPLYLYQIMRLEGCSQLDNKLIVGRVEDELSRKVVISDYLNPFNKDELTEIFDLDFDEDRLIGKAFSSTNPKPLNAVREFIDFYRPQLEFKNSEGFSSFNLETCCDNNHKLSKVTTKS
jgi:hypothetical protein